MTELFDFSRFPVLETAHLILRQLTPEDSEAVFRIRSDYEVTRHNIGPAYQTLQQATELIEAINGGFQDEMEIRWGITLRSSRDGVIGMCGYNYWSRHDHRASVGYDLARAYWGQGIMSEALRAVIDFGFTQMALNRVEADADVRNIASHRVLEKLGFRREGMLREQFYDGDGFYDLLLFSLLRREFR
jgi:ribosomal-protein-alanine N-acetyltransferase